MYHYSLSLYLYLSLSIYIYIHTYAYTLIYVCISLSLDVCVYIYIYMFIRKCVYIYIYITYIDGHGRGGLRSTRSLERNKRAYSTWDSSGCMHILGGQHIIRRTHAFKPMVLKLDT